MGDGLDGFFLMEGTDNDAFTEPITQPISQLGDFVTVWSVWKIPFPQISMYQETCLK